MRSEYEANLQMLATASKESALPKALFGIGHKRPVKRNWIIRLLESFWQQKHTANCCK